MDVYRSGGTQASCLALAANDKRYFSFIKHAEFWVQGPVIIFKYPNSQEKQQDRTKDLM